MTHNERLTEWQEGRDRLDYYWTTGRAEKPV
jgi:hypothetical protein